MQNPDQRQAGGLPSFARRLAAFHIGLRQRFVLLWALFALVVLFGATGVLKLKFDDQLLTFFNSDLAA